MTTTPTIPAEERARWREISTSTPYLFGPFMLRLLDALESADARAEKAEQIIRMIARTNAEDGCWRGYDAHGCEHEETSENICTGCWVKHFETVRCLATGEGEK